MRSLGTLLATGLALGLAACGGGSGPDVFDDSCPGAAGLAGPPCPCTSWTNYVLPSNESSGTGPSLSIDWSSTPAVATIQTGQRLEVSALASQKRPFSCNIDPWQSTNPSWSSSEPAVLGVERAEGRRALLLAVAPGSARVSAGNLPTSRGGVEQVDLTACRPPAQASLWDVCTSRAPLVIRVVAAP
jgi:hypothetical protein